MLLAAWAVAVAVPFLELVGRNAPFLVAHDLRAGRLIAYLAVLILAAPLGSWLLVLAFRRVGLDRVTLTLIVGALLALALLTLGAQLLPLPGVAIVAAALLLAAVLAPRVVGSDAGRRGLLVLGVVAPAWALGQFLFLTPAGALVSGSTSEVTASTTRETPVFMLMLDELPLTSLVTGSGEIDGRLFPGFAELAATSTWYPRAETFATNTARIVPSVLTGRRAPHGVELPVASAYPGTLFTLLGDRDIVALEPITRLCVVETCRAVEDESGAAGVSPWSVVAVDSAAVYLHQVLPTDLAAALPPIDQGWAGFTAAGAGDVGAGPGERTSEDSADVDDREPTVEDHDAMVHLAVWGDSSVGASALVDSVATATPTSFFFGHLMLPHSPWTHLPDGDRIVTTPRGEPARLVGGRGLWVDEPWTVAHMYQRHLLQVQFTDRIVTRFLEAIRDTGLWDEALVVVMSDHGVTFEPGQDRRSVETERAAADVLHVPLFIKYPGQDQGARPDVDAGMTDIAPTIADVLQITPRPNYQGVVLPRDAARSAEAIPPRRVLDAAALKYELFDLEGTAGLYGYRRDAGLTGTAVGEHRIAGPSVFEAQVDALGDLSQVERRDGVSPALVEGTLEGGSGAQEPPDRLAVAVDGVVAGLATPFVREGTIRFQVLVDPARLTPGAHDIDLYVVERAADGAVGEAVLRTVALG